MMRSESIYRDRFGGGRALADRLKEYGGRPDVLVLGLPRGGVPVAFEVAGALHVAMDVFVVRKLGVPGHEELAIGAVASGGVRVINQDVVQSLAIPQATLDEVTREEMAELDRRELTYRGGRSAPQVEGKTIILVDDGLATGSTMRAATQAVRQQSPRELVIAVPVAAAETCDELAREVDRVVCAATPAPFYAVGVWYEDFSQTTDREVRELLERAAQRVGAGAG